LYPRHTENDFIDLQNGADYVTINGYILPEEYKENMDENYIKENSTRLLFV